MKDAQDLGLAVASDNIANFIEEYRSVVALLEFADALGGRARNAPFSWPNSSLSRQVLRNGGAV